MVQDYGVGSTWMLPSTLLPGNYEVAVNMTTSSASIASSSINFNVFDKHDFNGDGKTDILWRNNDDRERFSLEYERNNDYRFNLDSPRSAPRMGDRRYGRFQ